VCQTWRDEIDELCEFSVELDDRKPFWKRLLHLRIKSCTILSFLELPPFGVGTTCLKHPNLIRDLKILTPRITGYNLFYFLSDCSASLRRLALQLNFPLLGTSFQTPLNEFDFRNLTHFEIIVSTHPPRNPETDGTEFHEFRRQSCETLFTQLMLNPIQRLTHLKIELQLLATTEVSKYTGLVLTFIQLHWQTLVALDMELIQGNHGIPTFGVLQPSDPYLEDLDFKALDKVNKLRSLRIVSSSLIGINLWLQLLQNQRRLEFCEVDVLAQNSQFVQTVVHNGNFETLKFLEISDLPIWNSEGEPEPFDLTVLQPCVHLKKLVLDRNVGNRRQYDCAELLNLHLLPGSLHELALNYFNVLSIDLLEFTGSEAGQNLQNLTLTQCGKLGPYGITGTVLEAVIALQSILFIEISVMNFSDPEERLKLNSILAAHGYGEDHAYFQLSKFTSLILGLQQEHQQNEYGYTPDEFDEHTPED